MSTEPVDTHTTTATDPAEPTIDVRVTLPATTAVALKHRTSGVLDVAETLSFIAQLYAESPMEPGAGARVLTREQFNSIAEALGFTPQTIAELVAGVCDLGAISFGGVRLKFTAEEVAVINARNATELPAKEWAALILRQMFEAWRDGRI